MRILAPVALLFASVLLCSCQSRPVESAETAREPAAAARPEGWRELDYDQPEKAEFFADVVWRAEELTARAQLVDRCGLTAVFRGVEPVEQELLFVRLTEWPAEKLLRAHPWLSETSLRCLLRTPNT